MDFCYHPDRSVAYFQCTIRCTSMICFSWSSIHFTQVNCTLPWSTFRFTCSVLHSMWSAVCTAPTLQFRSVVAASCTSEVVQCIEVLHCTGTANALHLHCTSIWVKMLLTVIHNRMLCWFFHVFLITHVKSSQQTFDRILLWIVWSVGRVYDPYHSLLMAQG